MNKFDIGKFPLISFYGKFILFDVSYDREILYVRINGWRVLRITNIVSIVPKTVLNFFLNICTKEFLRSM